jgi:hypothetical protein
MWDEFAINRRPLHALSQRFSSLRLEPPQPAKESVIHHRDGIDHHWPDSTNHPTPAKKRELCVCENAGRCGQTRWVRRQLGIFQIFRTFVRTLAVRPDRDKPSSLRSRHASVTKPSPSSCQYPPVITHTSQAQTQGKSLRLRISAVASAIALATSALVVLTSPQVTANTYAVPAAPTIKKAYVTSSGVRVVFEKVTASPAVNAYVLSGGEGSCPIT